MTQELDKRTRWRPYIDTADRRSLALRVSERSSSLGHVRENLPSYQANLTNR